jgi:hypothetical protein
VQEIGSSKNAACEESYRNSGSLLLCHLRHEPMQSAVIFSRGLHQDRFFACFGPSLTRRKDLADLPPERRPIPPLLWYRNRLRAVWAGNDQHGYGLAVLLGFEREAKNIGKEHPGEIYSDALVSPMLVPGQPTNRSKQDTTGGLPQGRPVINGVTGEIGWEFGCALQQGVYDLMQNRWRAEGLPELRSIFHRCKDGSKGLLGSLF